MLVEQRVLAAPHGDQQQIFAEDLDVAQTLLDDQLIGVDVLEDVFGRVIYGQEIRPVR